MFTTYLAGIFMHKKRQVVTPASHIKKYENKIYKTVCLFSIRVNSALQRASAPGAAVATKTYCG